MQPLQRRSAAHTAVFREQPGTHSTTLTSYLRSQRQTGTEWTKLRTRTQRGEACFVVRGMGTATACTKTWGKTPRTAQNISTQLGTLNCFGLRRLIRRSLHHAGALPVAELVWVCHVGSEQRVACRDARGTTGGVKATGQTVQATVWVGQLTCCVVSRDRRHAHAYGRTCASQCGVPLSYASD